MIKAAAIVLWVVLSVCQVFSPQSPLLPSSPLLVSFQTSDSVAHLGTIARVRHHTAVDGRLAAVSQLVYCTSTHKVFCVFMFVVFFQKPNKFSFTIHGGKANFQILLADHSVCTVHITEGA